MGALSVATDLAVGVPLETSLRNAVLAVRLGRKIGLEADALSDLYYATLLRHLGCTSFSHEAAALGAGDDQQFLQTFEGADATQKLATARRAVQRLAQGASIATRTRTVAKVLVSRSIPAELATAQCAQAAALATDLGMSDGIVLALGQIYERYDGLGAPRGLVGEAIDRVARVVQLIILAEALHRRGGWTSMASELRKRRGGQVDPELCDVFLDDEEACAALFEATSVWETFVEAEPSPRLMLDDARLDAIAVAFGRYADLKVPMMIGHSTQVAAFATEAGRRQGLGPDELTDLRRAALLHDLGAVSVPTGIWEKPGPFNDAEWERVRLHAYYSHRILGRVPALADAARIAGAHHERCDGSGYPQGVPTSPTERSMRLLQAAEVYQAMISDRPHRPARSPSAAAEALLEEVSAGRLCARAVDALLAAVGQSERVARTLPAGLTAREAEVLLHLARGATNKEIARKLDISARTVQHHIEHIYGKVGVSTRAAAALFAARNDLVS